MTPMTPDKYDEHVEKQIQLLTQHAYLKLNLIATLIGSSPATCKKILNRNGVFANEFGYLTTDVIKALKLKEYLNNLLKLRGQKKSA